MSVSINPGILVGNHAQHTVVCKNLLGPVEGADIINPKTQAGRIWRPTLIQKATTPSLVAADIACGLIACSNTGALEIPAVEQILAEFANRGRTFKVGESFQVLVTRTVENSGDIIIGIATQILPLHAPTWACALGVDETDPLVVLFHDQGAGPHSVLLTFEVTALGSAPAMIVHALIA